MAYLKPTKLTKFVEQLTLGEKLDLLNFLIQTSNTCGCISNGITSCANCSRFICMECKEYSCETCGEKLCYTCGEDEITVCDTCKSDESLSE